MFGMTDWLDIVMVGVGFLGRGWMERWCSSLQASYGGGSGDVVDDRNTVWSEWMVEEVKDDRLKIVCWAGQLEV
jgi:hypothetical protein